MRAIIKGRIYDTENATRVFEAPYHTPTTESNYVREVLYKTKRENWFIDGEGGPHSKYRRPCGKNTWKAGHRITPMSREETLEWLEDQEAYDIITEYFSDLVEEA